MDKLDNMEGICEYFMTHPDEFKSIFDSINAHEEPLPGEWDEKLNGFEKMIILKALRSDKIIPAI